MKIQLSNFENIPIDLSISEAVKFSLLFATGIVNPFGPTLNTYFIDDRSNIIKIRFHPLNIETLLAGKITNDKELNSIENITLSKSNFANAFFSLFLVGKEFNHMEFYDFFSELSNLNSASSYEQLVRIRKFPGDPFSRVSEEITSSASRIVEEYKKSGEFLSENNHQTSQQEISEHFKYLTNPEYVKKEIAAFEYAWKGSIDHMNVKSLVKMFFEEFNQAFSEIICKSNLPADSLGKWKSLIGTLCDNIWHNTNHDFIKSKDFLDMEWPFLCALYVFHNWDNSILSKKFSIPELIPEINAEIINFKDVTLIALKEIKFKMRKMSTEREATGKMKIEHSKIFISIFTQSYMNSFEGNLDRINPKHFFQFGLEILLLFTLEVREKDKPFFDLIEDIGPFELKEAKNVLEQINAVF